MRNSRRPALLLFIAVMFLLFGMKSTASAQISLSPAVIDIVAPPNESAVSSFTVMNLSDTAIRVTSGATPWRVPAGEEPVDPATWLRIFPPEFDLPAHSEAVVNILATPLPDQEEEVAAMVFFEAAPADQENSSMGYILRSSAPVYMAVYGRSTVGFDITSMKVTQDSGLTFIATVENLGTMHLRPGIKVELYNDADTLVYRGERTPFFPVFPGQPRIFEFKWVIWQPGDLPDGRYILRTISNFFQDLVDVEEFEVVVKDQTNITITPITDAIIIEE